MKEIKGDEEFADEYNIMKQYKTAYDAERKAKKAVKEAEKDLDKKVIEQYKQLNSDEVKTLVVDDKWLPTIKEQIDGEVEAISRSLTQQVNQLAGRYDKAMVEINEEVDKLESSVQSHLEAIRVAWN